MPKLTKPGRGLEVHILAHGAQASKTWLLGKLKRVLKTMGVAGGTWTVKVAGDVEMRELHGRMMGIWETTDVLTFDMREEEGGGNAKRETRNAKRRGKAERNESRITDHGSRLRGGMDIELDTVICVDEARRRADEMGHSVREELLLYCAHSLLHVQGYDDVTAKGAWEMHAREDELLVAAGVGAVYAGRKLAPPKASPRTREKGIARSRRR